MSSKGPDQEYTTFERFLLRINCLTSFFMLAGLVNAIFFIVSSLIMFVEAWKDCGDDYSSIVDCRNDELNYQADAVPLMALGIFYLIYPLSAILTADVVRIFFTDIAAGLTIAYSTCRAFDQTDVVHGEAYVTLIANIVCFLCFVGSSESLIHRFKWKSPNVPAQFKCYIINRITASFSLLLGVFSIPMCSKLVVFTTSNGWTTFCVFIDIIVISTGFVSKFLLHRIPDSPIVCFIVAGLSFLSLGFCCYVTFSCINHTSDHTFLQDHYPADCICANGAICAVMSLVICILSIVNSVLLKYANDSTRVYSQLSDDDEKN